MSMNGKGGKVLLAVIFLAGITLILTGYFKGNEKNTAEYDITRYEELYKAQLEEILKEIDGIGEIKLMVTGEGAGENYKITGVAVICRGGGDIRVQKDVVGIITALFAVSSNRIYVTSMKS